MALLRLRYGADELEAGGRGFTHVPRTWDINRTIYMKL
jgi:hypothetical protein